VKDLCRKAGSEQEKRKGSFPVVGREKKEGKERAVFSVPDEWEDGKALPSLLDRRKGRGRPPAEGWEEVFL